MGLSSCSGCQFQDLLLFTQTIMVHYLAMFHVHGAKILLTLFPRHILFTIYPYLPYTLTYILLLTSKLAFVHL